MENEPAYTRLTVDERRNQLLDTGSRLFAEHAYEEISMRQVAQAAGVSKPLLYHYFRSKTELFKAAVSEKAAELTALIAPSGKGTPLDQLNESLDAYLAWIEDHAHTWSKLMQTAATLPEASELVEGFRHQTLELLVSGLTGKQKPRPALRVAIKGWLGYLDAAILDWIVAEDLSRRQLRDLLAAAFTAVLLAARQADPKIRLPLLE